MSDTYDSAQAETWTCPKCGWKYSSILGGAVRGPAIHAYEQPTCVQGSGPADPAEGSPRQREAGEVEFMDSGTAVDTIDAKIAAHLAYLDSNAAHCTSIAKMGTPLSDWFQCAASVYEEVAAELRHTLGIETP
jgi:rubredoxin